MLTPRTTGTDVSSENPHALIQLPLYDQEIAVLCAIIANSITGPVFYEGILDA
jgi:hypothetical protein